MTDAQEKVQRLSTLKETPEYAELEQLHKTKITPIKLEDLSGHVKGRANIMSKIKELFENSQKEITICTSVSDFENKSRVLLPSLEKLNKNGVKIKVALSGDQDRIRKLNSKHNIKARPTDNQGRFFIADRKETFFMINSEGADEEVGVWLNSPYFSRVFASMFDSYSRK